MGTSVGRGVEVGASGAWVGTSVLTTGNVAWGDALGVAQAETNIINTNNGSVNLPVVVI